VEGNWESGLPLLARAADPLWAAAAKLDLQPSKSSAALVRTGDAWARVHEAQRSREPTPASLRARDCYQKALGEATGLDRAGIMKKLDALGEAEGGATGNWFVVFRSDNPSDWNKKMNEGFQRYAVPLSEAPSPVRYIRIRRMNGESVVLPANGLKLAVDGVAGRYGWSGGQKQLYGDVLLGIYDREKQVAGKAGKIWICNPAGQECTGWGFGHQMQSGRKTHMAWAGEVVPREVLEIAVLVRELSTIERRQATVLSP
jgi:hypothetical protein